MLTEVRDTRLWVEDSGGDAPIVAFSHGLLWSAKMFEVQQAGLADAFRIVAWDHRGQGRSAPVADRVAAIEDNYLDAVEVLERLGRPVHFVGLSMGGFVGLRLAARRPDLVRSLVLMCTAADPEPEANHGRYKLLGLVARVFGVGLVAGRVMPIMFGQDFLDDPARDAERARWREELTGNRRDIVKAVLGVIERDGVEDEVGRIGCPTLLLAGQDDRAIARPRMEALAAAIPGARLELVPKAGHSLSVEQGPAALDLMRAFYAELDAQSPV